MTKDEFQALPLRVALGVIFDAMPKRLGEMEAPKLPRPPKYDGRIPKGDKSFVWISEFDLSSLVWWQKKKADSAAEGGRYAEQNAKGAAALARWIEWRQCFPRAPWEGKRGDDDVVAQAPSRRPEQHPWKESASSSSRKEDDDAW
jgi:hypothetical protein